MTERPIARKWKSDVMTYVVKSKGGLRSRSKPVLQRLIFGKNKRRERLARLPIEEKVRIVAGMQRIANEVLSATGRPMMHEWPLD